MLSWSVLTENGSIEVSLCPLVQRGELVSSRDRCIDNGDKCESKFS